jgi:hypothetical protein
MDAGFRGRIKSIEDRRAGGSVGGPQCETYMKCKNGIVLVTRESLDPRS